MNDIKFFKKFRNLIDFYCLFPEHRFFTLQLLFQLFENNSEHPK